MLVSRIFWVLNPKIFDDMYSTEWFTVISSIIQLIWAFIPLVLAFAVKDKSKQIGLFIIGGLILCMGLYEMIHWLI